MLTVYSKMEKEELIITMEGRIESSNASVAEAAVFDKIGDYDGAIVLDMEKVDYVSSAGLRVILRIKKAHKNTRIVNVQSEVYEIFDMTGFTEMMDIAKAYRKFSVEGCEIIGEGANGIVYRIDQDTIVKVYRNADAIDEITRERELARKAFVMGVPTAIPYDVVRVGDSFGSVFELLDAASFASILQKQPERCDELAKASVEILKIMHATHLKPKELPDIKDEARSWVSYCEKYLKPETFVKLRRLIDEIPDTDNMLHGDFHLKNIMRQGKENLLIDMDTLTMGHPVFELAAVYLAYVGFAEFDPECIPKFMGISNELARKYYDATIRYYFETDYAGLLEEVEKKLRTLCFTRLVRRTIQKGSADPDRRDRAVAVYVAELERLLPTIDKLYF